jgi:hypothetical protein
MLTWFANLRNDLKLKYRPIKLNMTNDTAPWYSYNFFYILKGYYMDPTRLSRSWSKFSCLLEITYMSSNISHASRNRTTTWICSLSRESYELHELCKVFRQISYARSSFDQGLLPDRPPYCKTCLSIFKVTLSNYYYGHMRFTFLKQMNQPVEELVNPRQPFHYNHNKISSSSSLDTSSCSLTWTLITFLPVQKMP